MVVKLLIWLLCLHVYKGRYIDIYINIITWNERAPRSVLNSFLIIENVKFESQFTFSIISSLTLPLAQLNLLQKLYNLISSLITNIVQPSIPVLLLEEYCSKDSKTFVFYQDRRINQR